MSEATPPPPKEPLRYAPSVAGVSRRQINFFLLLFFINTILFAGFICLPSASPFLKQTWENYQRRRAEAADKAKLRSLIDACMTYTAPADQVVYAEEPNAADALMARSGHADLAGAQRLFPKESGLMGYQAAPDEQSLFASGWHPPADQGPVSPLIALASSKPSAPGTIFHEMLYGNVIFLHQMTTPAGIKRLVWISIEPTGKLIPQPNPADDSAPKQYCLRLGRGFKVTVMDENAEFPVETTAILQSTSTDNIRLIRMPDDKPELKNRSGYWRLYAGQPDAANPSHLTFAYDIDGKPGVIDGWLKDGDRLMLEPRAGRLIKWNSGTEYVWDLSPPSATRPAQ